MAVKINDFGDTPSPAQGATAPCESLAMQCEKGGALAALPDIGLLN